MHPLSCSAFITSLKPSMPVPCHCCKLLAAFLSCRCDLKSVDTSSHRHPLTHLFPPVGPWRSPPRPWTRSSWGHGKNRLPTGVAVVSWGRQEQYLLNDGAFAVSGSPLTVPQPSDLQCLANVNVRMPTNSPSSCLNSLLSCVH